MAGVERTKPFLHEDERTNVIILSWCGNDFERKTSHKRYYELDEKRLKGFVEMWRVARGVADNVIIVGPRTPEAWRLPPSWDSAADSCLSMLPQSGVYHFGLARMWPRMEKLSGDSYHAEGLAVDRSIDRSSPILDCVGYRHRPHLRVVAGRQPPIRRRPEAI